MSFDDLFSKRVSIARNSMGLTQSELAKKVGIVSRQIAAYEGNEAKPREKALVNLAAALGTTPEWLANGVGHGPDVSNVKKTITRQEIPVLDHMQVNIERGQRFDDGANIIDFIPSPPNAGEHAFAVKIEGNSMVSPFGISFSDGSIVTFDPDIEPQNGDFVLCAIYDDKLLTFKKLIHDQGRIFLAALNPDYPYIGIDDYEIVGVAIHTQMFIKRNQHVSEIDWNTIDAWDSQTQINIEHPLTSRMDKIEEKLNLLLDLIAKKP
ncbi:helix-turn-helix domain-containing protein [Yersinia massiliensis]|uniref:LexA family protein n=1 Tax=Yersinia massiliensis TaxID=419257 RepID=UPI001CFE1BBF|nr:S24 family peptidase [Yersinia massiliensis]MCB5318609.1 helix-turn-helix domain-containing protein [Yersinia massiliensis]